MSITNIQIVGHNYKFSHITHFQVIFTRFTNYNYTIISHNRSLSLYHTPIATNATKKYLSFHHHVDLYPKRCCPKQICTSIAPPPHKSIHPCSPTLPLSRYHQVPTSSPQHTTYIDLYTVNSLLHDHHIISIKSHSIP